MDTPLAHSSAPDGPAPIDAARALRLIAEGTSTQTGEGFLRSLVRHLARVLNLRFALVGELAPGEEATIQILAFWQGDDFRANTRYTLAGTPCGNVVGKQPCHYRSGVRERFPRDRMLQELGIESYLGVPLSDSAGEPLGLLAVMHDGPMPAMPEADAIFRIFAARAAAELERLRREQALRESEHRYRQLLHTINEGIWGVDLAGNTTYVNECMARMLGYSVEEMLGKHLSNFLDPQTRDDALKEFMARDKRQRGRYERLYRHKDGSSIRASLSANPAFDAAGKLIGAFAVVSDITERRAMEQALRSSEQRLRLLVQQAPAVLWTTDHNLVFTSSEGAGLKALGLAPEQVVGKPLREFLGPGPDADRIMQSHVDALAGRQSTYDQRWMDRYYRIELAPARQENGQISGVIGVAIDVTGYHRAEEELRVGRDQLEQRIHERTRELSVAIESLRESQQRYAGILNSQETLVVRCDLEGRLTYQNDAYAAAFGLKVGDTFYNRVHPEEMDAAANAMQQLLNPPHRCSLDQRCLIGGQWRWVHWQDSVIRDRGGTIVEIQGVGYDITERKTADEQLRFSEERLRRLIEQSPFPIQIVALDGRPFAANRAAADFWGLELQQIIGHDLLADPQLRERGISDCIRRAIAGETVEVPQTCYVPDNGRHAGHEHWSRAVIYPVRDPAGTVREVVIVQEDISQRREAELALRNSEQHFKELADYNNRLLREIDHRVRNNLAGLLSLVSLMRQRSTDVGTFSDAIEARIRALSHVHQLLGESGWRGVDLRSLLVRLFESMRHLARNPCDARIDGPEVQLYPRHALPLAMTLLEWCTNSCKYGASSGSGGQVIVTWSAEKRDGGHRICLRWREEGGPPITGPIVPSLGTELVRSFVLLELHGQCALSYPPTGVDHRIEFDSPL